MPRRFPWLLWGAGVLWAFYLLVFSLTAWMWAYTDSPLTPYLAWPSLWVWLWVVPTFSGIMPLLFPDGKLPSKRWRPVLYGNFVLMAGHSLLLALTPEPAFGLGLPIPNPFGVEALGDIPERVEERIGVPMVLLGLLGVASPGVRHRSATPEVRRQIAWYFSAMVIFIGFWAVTGSTEDPLIMGLRILLTGGIPIAIIAAVLRHQLYGIRLVLNRTLVYGTLTVFIGLIYSVLVWVVNRVSGNYGAVAGLIAAMVTGAVFHPVRLRLQWSADRLFGVERDPYKVADLLNRTGQRAGDPSEALTQAISVRGGRAASRWRRQCAGTARRAGARRAMTTGGRWRRRAGALSLVTGCDRRRCRRRPVSPSGPGRRAAPSHPVVTAGPCYRGRAGCAAMRGGRTRCAAPGRCRRPPTPR
ncbi:hypothetical protein FHS22_007469 [Planomonospora venezuelensis]|uniref:Uncharacterized protein n=1 Tax=Planomonospora venezuelensis TaxID=1999 RepID=A0A841DIM4_PLAVE|nr:hypothetical protein [Planomonospora venezuelensis]